MFFHIGFLFFLRGWAPGWSHAEGSAGLPVPRVTKWRNTAGQWTLPQIKKGTGFCSDAPFKTLCYMLHIFGTFVDGAVDCFYLLFFQTGEGNSQGCGVDGNGSNLFFLQDFLSELFGIHFCAETHKIA